MPKLIETIVSTKIKDLRVPISQQTTGRELFYKIVAHIGLKEIWYFGLQYTDSKGNKNWMKLNRKVFHHDIKWNGSVLRLKFRVKFYPEDLTDELIQLVTQKLFYLQAKETILEDVVYCPTEKAVLLASLACQADFGEYSQLPISGKFLNKEKLLPDRIINQFKLSKGDWDRRIAELWKRHGEMHSEDAIMAYLKIVQDLEMYGVTYFEIENRKGSALWLGIDTYGLHIYEKGNRLTPKVGFPWSEIRTLSFTNRKFIIKPLEKKSPDFLFGVPVVDTNKRILALSMGNHELYMRRRRPDAVEILQMKAEAKHEKKIKREEQMTLQRERAERQKAQQINKQLEERAKSLEVSAKETAEALEREINQKKELERQRISAEEENARQRERSRQIEQERNKISRELSQQENENEYLRNKYTAVNMEMQRALEEKKIRDRQLAEQEEMLKKRRASDEDIPDNIEDVRNNNRPDVSYSPVRGQHSVQEPDELDGNSSTAHNLPVMDNARLPEYDRDSTMDTYIQSYLDVLGKDIFPQLNETKLTSLDHIYAANIQAGRNKYKTLKRIRMGNTKQRIDEFECM